MGSKKMHWDLKNSFGISKNALRSQTMLWDLQKMQCNLKEMVDIVDIVDIVDTVEIVDIFDTFNIVDINEAIWNKTRL